MQAFVVVPSGDPHGEQADYACSPTQSRDTARRIPIPVNLRNRDFAKLLDLTPQDVWFLLKLAQELKAAKFTHGNGPQVGLLALQSAAYKDVEAYPLDVLGAESVGMIGYVIEQEFDRVLQSKIEAACAFARQTHNRAIIGSLDEAEAVLLGRAGTEIAMSAKGIEIQSAPAAV